MTTPTPGPLSPFENKSVRSVGVEIPNAAGGLREAMKLDPVEMHHGDKVFIVLECDVTKVRFDPVSDDSDDLKRVHVLNAAAATIVDEGLVREHLDNQAARIEEAKRRSAGEFTLDEAQLEVAHDAGEHAAGLVAGCPPCDAEAAAAASEATDTAKPASIADRRREKAGEG